MKNRISSNRSWRILGFFLTLKMIGFESYTVFFCQSFDDGDILTIERTLVGVKQHISLLFNVWMSGAFLECRSIGSFDKRQIP